MANVSEGVITVTINEANELVDHTDLVITPSMAMPGWFTFQIVQDCPEAGEEERYSTLFGFVVPPEFLAQLGRELVAKGHV